MLRALRSGLAADGLGEWQSDQYLRYALESAHHSGPRSKGVTQKCRNVEHQGSRLLPGLDQYGMVPGAAVTTERKGNDMVVVVFRSRVRAGVDEEMNRVGQRMFELGSSMPGFLSYKDFVAEDGENVTIIEFESLETLAAWREHPEHKIAQQLGRTAFFTEYHIQVCTPVRDYRFDALRE